MIIVNQLHHELLIAYHRSRLNRLPYGFFEMHRGKPVVCIIRDPNNPGISSKNKRRLRVDSEQGKLYSRLVEEAHLIKSKLDQLISLWNDTYWKTPRELSFPLVKRTQSQLSPRRYYNSAEMQNPILSTAPLINYNGRELRSKNELIACKSLEHWGYEYKIEINLSPDEYTQLYPDATFYAPEIEKPISIEIDGALDKDSYQRKSEYRIGDYLKSGFEEYKDIIFLRLYRASDFYDDVFKNLITAAILCNLEDIVI